MSALAGAELGGECDEQGGCLLDLGCPEHERCQLAEQRLRASDTED